MQFDGSQPGEVQTSHQGDSPPAGVGESLGDAIVDGAALSAMPQPVRARERPPGSGVITWASHPRIHECQS